MTNASFPSVVFAAAACWTVTPDGLALCHLVGRVACTLFTF